MRTVQLTTLVLATTLAAAALAGLAEDVARQLSNPVAVLISLPFQFKHDRDFGPARDGSRRLADIQPVVPFELNDDWNIVSRTILPVVQRGNTLPGAGRQSGIGDAVQRLFLSPKAPSSGGGVLLQQRPRTVGAPAMHIWSFAGTERPPRSPRTSLP